MGRSEIGIGRGCGLTSAESRAVVHSNISYTLLVLLTTHNQMANVQKAFEEYPADKLDGVWACYCKNLCSVIQSDGGNDYKQAHKGGKRRKTETGSAIDLSVNLDNYEKCVSLRSVDNILLLVSMSTRGSSNEIASARRVYCSESFATLNYSRSRKPSREYVMNGRPLSSSSM